MSRPVTARRRAALGLGLAALAWPSLLGVAACTDDPGDEPTSGTARDATEDTEPVDDAWGYEQVPPDGTATGPIMDDPGNAFGGDGDDDLDDPGNR